MAVLLIVMIALAAMAALTKGLWGGGNAQLLAQSDTQLAFKSAKEGLLAYVAENGRLPCPSDITTISLSAAQEGTSQSTCGAKGVSQIGLVPWKTLGVPVPRDGTNGCIWYAVSGNLKINAKTSPINADSNGVFTIRDIDNNILGDSQNNPAAAVLIAANTAITSEGYVQTRTPESPVTRIQCNLPLAAGSPQTANNVAKRYLDSMLTIYSTGTSVDYNNWQVAATAGATKTFVQGYINAQYPHPQVNDQLAWISAEEFGKTSSYYGARQAQKALSGYYSAASNYVSPASSVGGACDTSLKKGYLPSTCPIFDSEANLTFDTWKDTHAKDFLADEWHKSTHYVLSDKCKTNGAKYCAGSGNFLSVDDQNTLHTIGIIRGRSVTPCATPQACMENPNNIVAANNPASVIYESVNKTKFIPPKPNNDIIVFTK